ncbi:MAG: DUF2326 domain-containing protein [Clostridium sp.]
MLNEIICNEFKKKKVEFHLGLNTILGDDLGSNSIGKSTFLMIIDFVFGGKDYLLKSTDVQKNVGKHVIKFHFIFSGKDYYFSRDTNSNEKVNICDEKYNIKDEISLSKYCEFLKQKYQIDLYDTSFRDIVGRYSRIYGKENLNEKRPLDIISKEPSSKSINALFKLFDLYKNISELENLLREKEEALTTYKKAIKYNFIGSIGKRKYTRNLKEIQKLHEEELKLINDLENNLLDLNSEQAEQLIQLKNKLSVLKRYRSKLIGDIVLLKEDIEGNTSLKNQKINELLDFFPKINIKKLVEIEDFHNEIRKVLKDELKKKKIELQGFLEIAEKDIEDIENKIKKTTQSDNLSKTVLKKYSEIQKRKEILQKENDSFETLNTLKNERDDTKKRRDDMKQEELGELYSKINNKMQEINDYIYDKKKKSPIISFDKDQYTFKTVDDTGTGTSYKSMIVYDLSVLELTELPILIHDSVLLKQISDEAIEKILLKYQSFKKQIFISLDKVSSYSDISKKVLKNCKVLELAPNGNELFGRSWNNKNDN